MVTMAPGDMHHRICNGKRVAAIAYGTGDAWGNEVGGPWTGDLTRKMIAQATLVDVTNVRDYYFETNPKPVWTLDEDFKGVTPPFDNMWLEAPIPPRQYDDRTKTWVVTREVGHPIASALNFGVMVKRSAVRSPDEAARARDEIVIYARVPLHAIPPGIVPENVDAARKNGTIAVRERYIGARWRVQMWGLIELPDYVVGPIAVHDFYLDEKGDPIVEFPQVGVVYDRARERVRTASFISHPYGASHDEIARVETSAKHFLPFTDVAFLALSFMNCRNVQLVKREAVPLKKKQQRRGDVPRVAHHVIEITPMKPRKVLQTSSIAITADVLERSKKSLHIVRGHFKHYGEKWGTKKLFGRVSGKFWWDKHTAGDIDTGLVDSDYAVTP